MILFRKFIRYQKLNLPPGVVSGNGVVIWNVSQNKPVYNGGQTHVKVEPLK